MKKLQFTSFICLILMNTLSAQIVSTFAGSGTQGSTDGISSVASFDYPSGVCADASGNIYVADLYNHKIREITPSGLVSTFAGSGTQGAADGNSTAASFYYPIGVCSDISGNLYVADKDNHKIRKINLIGIVSTFAGSGSIGATDGLGSTVKFNFPTGVCADISGNIYVADADNHKIRKITPSGVVSTLAGSGTQGSADGNGSAASFKFPAGVCADVSGNIYVADSYNNKIRKITPSGVVSTFAGSGTQGSTDGNGSNASFYNPTGVCIDISGNIYVADSWNNKIRKITPSGVVSTFAGSGNQGSTDGNGAIARFNDPRGICADISGNIYVADAGNNKIRKITITSGIFENNLDTNFIVYPNPNKGEFILQTNTEGIYFIMNELGQTIEKKQLNTANNYTWNIQNLSPGIYFVIRYGDNKITTQKIIVTP